MVIFGLYNISVGNWVIEFYDLGDLSCIISLFIEVFDYCFDVCLIDVVVMDVVC